MRRSFGMWGLLAAAVAVGVCAPALAEQCGIEAGAPIYGMGVPVSTAYSPVLAASEARILAKGDRSAELRSIPAPKMDVSGLPIDYAVMRMSLASGRGLLAVMDDGQSGTTVEQPVVSGSMADAIEAMARQAGLRWRYDGEKVWFFRANEWKLLLPAHRDLRSAVSTAVMTVNPKNVRFVGNEVLFEGDRATAERLSAEVASVYAQGRINPHDVTFYRVYPQQGAIAWDRLVERTESVEVMAFNGKGVSLVLDPTAGAVVDTFLAREGRVVPIGSTTMVSPSMDGKATRYAGCGESLLQARSVTLGAGGYEGGRIQLSYSIVGGKDVQNGELSAAPGSVVVLADGEPHEGAYLVAVVRPRILEMEAPQAVQPVPFVQPAAPAPASTVIAAAVAAK